MAPKGKDGKKSGSKAGGSGGGPIHDDPDLEAAEEIGSQLWVAFAHGAQIPRVPPGIVQIGRRLSGPHVRKNVKHLLADPALLARTLECAHLAGVIARRNTVGPPKEPPTVDEGAFVDAWHEVEQQQKKTLERLRRIFGTTARRGGAC